MNTFIRETALRVVILKQELNIGVLLGNYIIAVWPQAEVQVCHLGREALKALQVSQTSLFIAGTRVDDMDGVEHLETLNHEVALPILVYTGRRDPQTFRMLNTVRWDGLLDTRTEAKNDKLIEVIELVLRRQRYVSPALVPLLQQRKNVTLDALTKTEEDVLAAMGDGADDQEAAERLNMREQTVATHRKKIMRKLRIHHRGHLTRYAVGQGVVDVNSDQTIFPGFERRLRRRRKRGSGPGWPDPA